ncbi:hypothetical protein [Macrococcus brunensis]|uniref:hypothetical protein n=1 Tax=Macrococcus brunensis TaxID=198483 RepID=UPI001EF09BAC|nr:hypothetical protein [Macrococcus brunensis]ULG71274.1 hypothetical protein MGG12_07970 [Macrococcus brunensis]
MKQQITWQEAWRDYTRNFFKPKAPISYEMYKAHSRLVRPLGVVLTIIWFIIIYQIGKYPEGFWNRAEKTQDHFEIVQSFKRGLVFILISSAIILPTLPTELRMFTKRGKSGLPYMLTFIFFVVGGITFSFITFYLNMKGDMLFGVLMMLVLIFMNNQSYVDNVRKTGADQNEQ